MEGLVDISTLFLSCLLLLYTHAIILLLIIAMYTMLLTTKYQNFISCAIVDCTHKGLVTPYFEDKLHGKYKADILIENQLRSPLDMVTVPGA